MRFVLAACCALSLVATDALADDAVAPFGGTPLAKQTGVIEAGGFYFRPLVDIRARAEVWAPGPFGLEPQDALLAPPTPLAVVPNDALIAERARFGIAAERGPVSAVITLQDARQYGTPQPTDSMWHQLPSFAPYEAYVDVHTLDRQIFFRLGRQEVLLGDGRLVGVSDASPKGQSLDAARLGARIKNFDVQALAALLEAPSLATQNSGTELFALDITWRALPLFAAELSGLARIARDGNGKDRSLYTPSNTFVPWLRLFGDRRGFRYSVTGALEAGQIAVVGAIRKQLAGGAAGRAEWETALPWRFTFGLDGAYASGQDPKADPKTTSHVFDPILPDRNEHFGQSGFIGWSNVIEGVLDVAAYPVDMLRLKAGYRFSGLADPHGVWFSSSLFPVGQSSTNSSHILGNTVELGAVMSPWSPLSFRADYAVMIMGAGGKALLHHDFAHYGRVEVEARFP